MNENRNEPANVPTDAWWAFVMSELQAHEFQQRSMFGDIDDDLIADYASGTCSPVDRAKVELAMEKYPAVREAVAAVRTAIGHNDSGRRIRPMVAASIFAIAASLLAVAFGIYAFNRPENPAAQIAALERRVSALQGAAADESSVRKLREDVLGSPVEVAALAWHSDKLLDFMTRTRPRSPDALEAEFTTQVDRLRAALAARPVSQPGRPGVVLADLPAEQGEYAERVYGNVWQHAGKTGRKLNPKLESFLLDARRPGENVGMIAPLYCYSMDASERANWDRIVALAGKSLPVKIINTRIYTDGFVPTKAYDEAIEHARAAGVEVYAYINCNGGDTSEQKIEDDLRAWHDKFPGRFSGIYFDNQSMYEDSRLDYFTRVFQLARRIEPKWKIISATDKGCAEAFAKILEDSIICYKIDVKSPEFQGWENKYGRGRFAALIHGVERLDEAELTRAAAIFGWVYITGKPEADNPYRRPPPYLSGEAEILRKLNSGAEPPDKGRQADQPRPISMDRLALDLASVGY